MSVSNIPAFIQNPSAKKISSNIDDSQVFGLGVSWNKKDSSLDTVRLVIRDKYRFNCFSKFAKTEQEKSVVNFFDSYPRGLENPDDGLHGNVFAIKINNALEVKKAFYRRIDKHVLSFEEGQWFRYQYEDFSDYPFVSLNFPKETEENFKLEIKCDMEGNMRGACLYPKYSSIKILGSMRDGCGHYFKDNIDFILKDYPDIIKDCFQIQLKYNMVPVSIGESGGHIKIYYIDFNRNRLLLKSI